MLYAIILVIEVGLPPIKSIAMTRYMMYKYKINSMGDHRLPKIALKSIKATCGSKEVGLKTPWLG